MPHRILATSSAMAVCAASTSIGLEEGSAVRAGRISAQEKHNEKMNTLKK